MKTLLLNTLEEECKAILNKRLQEKYKKQVKKKKT